MPDIEDFCRQVRSRSKEHQQAMRLLSGASLAGQMVAILRQELDSMVRVIYLLAQPFDRRVALLDASVNGKNGLSRIPSGLSLTKKWLNSPSVCMAGLNQFTNLAVLSYIYLSCMITMIATHLGSSLSGNDKTFFSTAELTTEVPPLMTPHFATSFLIFQAF
jgi:hypothetical protein